MVRTNTSISYMSIYVFDMYIVSDPTAKVCVSVHTGLYCINHWYYHANRLNNLLD